MNKQALEAYVKEVAGDDPDIASKMLEILGSKEDAANRFLSGFEGRAESTRRFQEAAQTKKQAETLITDYEQRLTSADEKIKKIMSDAASDKISLARAKAMLQVVKEKYALADDDIPSDADVRFAADKGVVPKDSGIDIEARLKTFEDDLFKRISEKIVPEMSGLAAIPIVWSAINGEHFELTGKRLTKQEQAEIMREAREKNMSLEDVWMAKHNIPLIREQKSDEIKKAKWKDEWDKAEQARRTEEALSGGQKRDGVEMVPASQRSPLLQKKFDVEAIDGDFQQEEINARKSGSDGRGKTDGKHEEKRLRGADAAAANFMRRRSLGLQWGEPEKKAG